LHGTRYDPLTIRSGTGNASFVAITEETRAKILNPNVPLEEKYKDVTHFVVEDIGGGLEDIEIIFLRT